MSKIGGDIVREAEGRAEYRKALADLQDARTEYSRIVLIIEDYSRLIEMHRKDLGPALDRLGVAMDRVDRIEEALGVRTQSRQKNLGLGRRRA
jgi:hypothetical protein